MPTYIVLVNYDTEARKNIRDFPKGRDLVNKQVHSLGGKISRYFTQGGFDAVAIIELPSDEAMQRLAMYVGSLGGIRTTTMRAFPEEEFVKLIGELPPPL